jgi:hypothetical protein
MIGMVLKGMLGVGLTVLTWLCLIHLDRVDPAGGQRDDQVLALRVLVSQHP